jgi:hypothetical protein
MTFSSGIVARMSDSLLVEALDDTRSLLDELEDDDDLAATSLRERVDVLERAQQALELRPASRELVIRLAKLAIAVRDDAVQLRMHHRSVQRLIQKMMD